MTKRILLQSLRKLIALGALLLLTGCEYNPLCSEKIADGLRYTKAQMKANIREYNRAMGLSSRVSGRDVWGGRRFAPGGVALAANEQVDHRLALTAPKPGPFTDPLFKNLPHQSTGKFIAQVTVALATDEGIRDNQSSGGIKFYQNEYPLGEEPPAASRLRYLAVTYNSAVRGMHARVRDFDGNWPGIAATFPDTTEVDLRIQQTDTQLIFSARPTPTAGGPTTWTILHTEDTPVDESPFDLSIGMRDVDEGATFFFKGIAVEGDGVGGEAEQRVIAQLKASMQSLEAAKSKLAGNFIDMNAVKADVLAAETALNAGYKSLMTAFVDLTLQSDQGAVDAKKALRTAAKDLAVVKVAMETLDPAKAKAKAATCDKVVLSEKTAMANLLGWKGTGLKKLPPDLFHLSIP